MCIRDRLKSPCWQSIHSLKFGMNLAIHLPLSSLFQPSCQRVSSLASFFAACFPVSSLLSKRSFYSWTKRSVETTPAITRGWLWHSPIRGYYSEGSCSLHRCNYFPVFLHLSHLLLTLKPPILAISLVSCVVMCAPYHTYLVCSQ